MTNSSNPTWYDILGVPRDASPEQVKAAWRAATDKFEPGSGTSQFRLFNEAADVLLDPERRAAYDAALGDPSPHADVSLREDGAEPEPGAEPAVAPPPPGPFAPAADDTTDVTDAPDDTETTDTTGVADESDTDDGAPRRRLSRLRGLSLPGGRIGILVLALVGAVAAGAIALAVVTALRIDDRVEVFESGPEATAAAERALTAVLSYDYRHMEADRDRAARFLTPKYEKQYLKTFALLTEGPDGSPGGAVKTKAVVTADVLNTGVVDADSDLVRVIAFVNQSSVKGDAQPAIFQNRVVVTMVHRDGDWLVDNITSY